MVSFVKVNDTLFKVYIAVGARLAYLGDAYTGGETAYFKTPTGRGKLFGSVRELEDRLEATARRVAERHDGLAVSA